MPAYATAIHVEQYGSGTASKSGLGDAGLPSAGAAEYAVNDPMTSGEIRLAGNEEDPWSVMAPKEEGTGRVADRKTPAAGGLISFSDVSDPVALLLLGTCMFAGAGVCVYRASLVARRLERQVAIGLPA